MGWWVLPPTTSPSASLLRGFRVEGITLPSAMLYAAPGDLTADTGAWPAVQCGSAPSMDGFGCNEFSKLVV